MNNPGQVSSDQLKPIHGLFLLASLVLYVVLRLPWVGHMLMWDEAMNLCSVRSFAARGHDYFSNWFWHHPPLLNLVLLLVQPLQPGFAERSHLLLIFIGILNSLALFVLCRMAFGTAAALWSVFFYAVMPAAIFFDLWIKQDPLATLFGMLSLIAFLRRRFVLSGALMGFALLAKEIAAFYAIGIGFLWLVQPGGQRKIRDLAVIALVALLLSAWWYVGFSPSIKYFIAFAVNSSKGVDVWVWSRPWHYFLGKLNLDLGFLGLALSLLGALAIGSRRGNREPVRLWPLAVLVPAYLLISAARGKAIWFTITLYPVFAALQGAGMQGLLSMLKSWLDRLSAKWTWMGRASGWAGAAVAVAVILYSTAAVWGRDYDRTLYEQDGGIWWGAAASRQAAATINAVARNDQKVLITPMSYWQYRDKDPCPIFTYYLKDIPVLVRPYDLSAQDVVDAVRKYRIDWAMVSPEGPAAREALLQPLIRDYGLSPVLLQGVCVFKTDSIYKSDASPRSESSP